MAKLTEQTLHVPSSDGRVPITGAHHLAGRPSNNRHTDANFAERFWRKVDRRGPDECWLWMGGRTTRGYGQVYLFSIGPTTGPQHIRARAHCVAWELTNGHIPDGLNVCHNCPTGDNPSCVNPKHLFLGTQAQNIHDAIRKGRFHAFGRQKLDAEQVRQIRALARQGLTHKAIGERFGIRRHSVCGIVNYRSWQHLDPLDAVFERVSHVSLPIRGEVA